VYRSKLFGALGAMILLASLLAACGATPTAEPTTVPAAVEPTAAPAEPTTAPAAAEPTATTAAAAEPTATTAAAAAEPTATAAAASGTPDQVALQLKWVAQAQFAGYYAALDQGYYQAENLELTIKPGGPDIAPEQVVASGQAQFGINWLASLLSVREQGTPLVNIAQIYTTGGMRSLSWKDSNIQSPADWKGKKVGTWFFGNEFNVLATLAKYNLQQDVDVTVVQQPFDMNLFLNKEVDAASAMTYNELYQVLAAGHTIDELNIIDYNAEGTAMPEDGIFADQTWLDADPKNKDIAARFLRASLKGWEYCRDNVDSCVDIVLKNDASGVMTKEAQKWQVVEVNKLIWGDPAKTDIKFGYMEPELFKRGADTALKFGVIKQPADEAAYTHEIWEMATGMK
jgi:NitT/TauT family transport system substrate-binding protein